MVYTVQIFQLTHTFVFSCGTSFSFKNFRAMSLSVLMEFCFSCHLWPEQKTEKRKKKWNNV